MFPTCECKWFHWNSLFSSWTNCKLLPRPRGICENEQVGPRDGQNAQAAERRPPGACYCKPQDHRFYREDTGMLGSVDVAQIPCIYREVAGCLVFQPVTLNSCESSAFSNFAQECSPVFRRSALLSGALARIKEAEGTNGFPCILNSLLYWLFLCHWNSILARFPYITLTSKSSACSQSMKRYISTASFCKEFKWTNCMKN